MSDVNTPFDVPISIADPEGYVHFHPTSGRKYQLKQMQVKSGSAETVDVWTAVSDVTNRTFIGAEDPMSGVPGAVEPVRGDLWWDSHQLELRVMHHPIVGQMSSGTQDLVYGKKQWISSTHPMANSINETGKDKNHMFGPLYINGDRETQLFPGEEFEVELEMPFYTGPDPLFSRSKAESGAVDPHPFPDKRYTLDWVVVPEYNGDMTGLDEAASAPYKNTITIPDSDFENQIEVKIGQVLGGIDPSKPPTIKIRCTATAKEDFNDLFVYTGDDSNGDPLLFSTVGESKVFQMAVRQDREIEIPIRFAKVNHAELISNEGANGSLIGDTSAIVDLAMMPAAVESTDPDGAAFSPLIKYSDLGLLAIDVEDPKSVEQTPAPTFGWNKSTFGAIVVRFDYGIDGTAIDMPTEISDEYTGMTSIDQSHLAGMTANDLAAKYKIEFFLDGYEQNFNGPPADPSALYQQPYTFETTSNIDVIDINGEDHVVRTVTLYHDINITPGDPGIYWTIRDGDTGNLLPEFHGVITTRNASRFEVEEDDEPVTGGNS